MVPSFRPAYLKKQIKLHRSARISYVNNCDIGQYVYIGPNCFFNAEGGLKIGEGSIFAPEVVILTSSHAYDAGELLPYDIYDYSRPVIIGRGVWVGYRAMIVPGVEIGDGAVVAMGGVVTKNVEPGDIVGGNPAKVIGHRNQNDLERMLENKAYFHRKHWHKRPKKWLRIK